MADIPTTLDEDADHFAGRGVGLSAVHQAITELGGSIVIRSTVGKGSKFKMLLPRHARLSS